MQEFEKSEDRTKKMKKTPSSHSSNSLNKCIDQVFKKNKYRGKYVKITLEKKNLLKEWLSKNSQPTSADFHSVSQAIDEPLDNVQKWYRNQKKTNKEIKKGVSKTKRILSKIEEEILEKAFRNNIKPKPEKYKELAKKISINSKQIRKWFKYRRRKLKKLFSEGVPMPSSQIKGKPFDSSESSYKTSNSSPNLSTNDLKSQQNNSSSDSNIRRQQQERLANNQQEMTSQKQEPENLNMPANNKQQSMNMPPNFNNMYQSQPNLGANYPPQMIFTYPLVQSNLDPSQQGAIPILSNNIYRIIQNAMQPMQPLVYVPNPQTPSFYINNPGFQQLQQPVQPVLIKNQAQPHFVVMNNRPGNNEMIKTQGEGFEALANDKSGTYCYMNPNKPVQISNNNQNLFNNIIYLKQNSDFVPPAQNVMPNLNLIQNLQILQPQNQNYCPGFQQNYQTGGFFNNGMYPMGAFNGGNVKVNNGSTNPSEKMGNFNEDHKMEDG